MSIAEESRSREGEESRSRRKVAQTKEETNFGVSVLSVWDELGEVDGDAGQGSWGDDAVAVDGFVV